MHDSIYSLLLSLISFIVFFPAGSLSVDEIKSTSSFLLVSVSVLLLLCALVAVSPSALFVFPVNLSAHHVSSTMLAKLVLLSSTLPQESCSGTD